MTTDNLKDTRIVFIKGESIKNKATFQVGQASIPASVVTRFLNKNTSKSERHQERDFIATLAKNYSEFLDELDKQEISMMDAIRIMESSRIVKKTVKGSKTKKLSEAMARTICRIYAEKTAEEMVQAFQETIKSPDFEGEVLISIQEMEEKFGRNKHKKIRVRALDESAVGRAEKAREGRKTKAKE